MTDRLVYDAKEAAAAIGVGENRIYELVASGAIPAIKWGPSKIVIPKRGLEAFLDEEAVRQQDERRRPSERAIAIAETVAIRRRRSNGATP